MTSPPSLGEIVYLASCVMQLDSEAIATPPDTPNQYSAGLKVMSDAGDMNLDAVMGKQGPPGQAQFALRQQTTVDDTKPNAALVSSPSGLPTLTNAAVDIGKYWVLDEVDDQGHVLNEFAYIWWGTYYRQVMMGVVGPPGPAPQVDPLVTLVAPGDAAYVKTSGSALYPTWDFMIPAPAGPPGPVRAVGFFPDVDESVGPANDDLLGFTGRYNTDGYPIFGPVNIEQYVPQTWSMPESYFNSYNGVSQQAFIGSFADIPPQPFPWTPLVWGHIGGYGVSLSSAPLMIGCQVLLGNQTTGIQVGRGMGNTLGVVNIMPHYSSSGATNASINPTNNRAIVPANHTGDQGTLYVNLYNDGANGAYLFNPTDSQLFITVMPMLRSHTS